ncbi:methyltransferase domain-containing protein [bacterium]|nr:methyltransferase domain-containing protein [bacterium]
MNKYVFVLGKNKGLSLAEIFTVFNKDKCDLLDQVAILDLEKNLEEVKEKINVLGGTIKIGRVIKILKKTELEKDLPDLIYENFKNRKITGKCIFGISSFSDLKINYKNLGIKIKQYLKDKGMSSRWVNLAGKITDSAVSYHNKLDKSKGLEIFLIKNSNGDYLVSEVFAIQPFISFSDRDYGRPSRDSLSGMLPPKLAKIMLNLAKSNKNSVVLDPFCGSGTVINEALFMGVKKVFGSDISEKAVFDTKNNLKWFADKYNKDVFNVEIKRLDASILSKNNFLDKIDVIVTEPYLGPQRGRVDISQTKKELEKLYSNFLQSALKILEKNSRIVMVWPIFKPEKKSVFLEPNFKGYKIIKYSFLNKNRLASFRGTQIYGRSGQKIWREIVVLEKE